MEKLGQLAQIVTDFIIFITKILMKHKIWNMNQNYAARTIANKELSKTKDTLMLGQRATLYTQYRKEHSTISHHEDVLVSK